MAWRYIQRSLEPVLNLGPMEFHAAVLFRQAGTKCAYPGTGGSSGNLHWLGRDRGLGI